jgi:hypothetical protein
MRGLGGGVHIDQLGSGLGDERQRVGIAAEEIERPSIQTA